MAKNTANRRNTSGLRGFTPISEKTKRSVDFLAVADDPRYADFSKENVWFMKQIRTKENLDRMDRVISQMHKQFNTLIPAQKKALYKLEQANRTLKSTHPRKATLSNLAQDKQVLQDTIAAIKTLDEYGGYFGWEDSSAKVLKTDFQRYGRLLFGTGRGFGTYTSDEQDLYRARLNVMNALKGADRVIKDRSSQGSRYKQAGTTLAKVGLDAGLYHESLLKAYQDIAADKAFWEDFAKRKLAHHENKDARGGVPTLSEMSKWKGYVDMQTWTFLTEETKAMAYYALKEAVKRPTEEARLKRYKEAQRNITAGMKMLFGGEFVEEKGYYTYPYLTPESKSNLEDSLWELELDKKTYRELIKEFITNPSNQIAFMDTVNGLADAVKKATAPLTRTVFDIDLGIKGLLDFSSFFDYPIHALMVTLNMGVNGTVSSMSFVSRSLGAFTSLVSSVAKMLIGSDDDEDDEDDNDDSEKGKKKSKLGRAMKLVGMIMNLISMVFNLIATGITLLASVVRTGFSMFTDLFSSSIKMFKEIAKTSELMKQIANILNLCITLFFMPFFNEFGNKLLDCVYGILTWIITEVGPLTAKLWEEYNEHIVAVIEYIAGHKDEIIRISEKFMGTIMGEESGKGLIDLIPDFIKFANYMVDTFVANRELMFSMLQKGIDAGSAMLDANVMAVMLNRGVEFFEWFLNKKDNLVKLLKTTFNIARWCLKRAEPIIKYLRSAVEAAVFILATVSIASLINRIPASDIATNAVIAAFAASLGPLGGAISTALVSQIFNKIFSFSSYSYDVPELGTGAYIPSTPGGRLVIVAEKETEYIIPQSKMHMIRGHNNVVINFNEDVFMVDNIESTIRDVVKTSSMRSLYR